MRSSNCLLLLAFLPFACAKSHDQNDQSKVQSQTTKPAPHTSPIDATKAPEYNLVSVPAADIDKHMKLADAESGLPVQLQGLFWMDGNPLPEEVISFARAKWDASKRQAVFNSYDDSVWSFHANPLGAISHQAYLKGEASLELTFDEDFAGFSARIFTKIAGRTIKVPDWATEFRGTYVNDDLWIRSTTIGKQNIGDYNLRRIVRPDGTRNDDVFAAFLNQAPENLYVAKWKQ